MIPTTVFPWWFDRSMRWMDGLFSETHALLVMPEPIDETPAPPNERIVTRNSSWYALGLAMRDAPGDLERCERIVSALLPLQFDRPGTPHHGTWPRFPGEREPQIDATIWRDYDPNWREFIATALLVLLSQPAARRLREQSVTAIDRAVTRAAEGSAARDVSIDYTNIVLMQIVLLAEAGARDGRPEWSARAVDLARSVHARVRRYGAFGEFNSPTYAGVDLYALELLDRLRSNPVFASLARIGKRVMWKDLSGLYHPGLGALCGPYDRTYANEMRSSVALAGFWIADAVEPERAPLPAGERFGHAYDFCFAPSVAALRRAVPPSAARLLRRPDAATRRTVRRTPPGESDRRRRTVSRLRPGLMWGGMRGSAQPATRQHVPAICHWSLGDGAAAGSIRIRCELPIDVRVTPRGLAITPARAPESNVDPVEILLEVCLPATSPRHLAPARLELPGLDVTVRTSRSEQAVSWSSRPRTIGATTTVAYSIAPSPSKQELLLSFYRIPGGNHGA